MSYLKYLLQNFAWFTQNYRDKKPEPVRVMGYDQSFDGSHIIPEGKALVDIPQWESFRDNPPEIGTNIYFWHKALTMPVQVNNLSVARKYELGRIPGLYWTHIENFDIRVLLPG